jgi:phosphoribosylglycinamide formyltransferase-1
MKSIVILISGRGSNMRALIDAELPATVAAVISNRADAQGLQYAASRGIPTVVVEHRDYPSREAFDAALSAAIDRFHPALVVLAGFLRVLTTNFVEHYEGRMINIHPSLLPAFPGLHTHRRALEAHATRHGCSVHFVTPELDHGPIIAQAEVPVLPDDDEDTLAARVLQQEHVIYPQAVRDFLQGRLAMKDGKVQTMEAGA